MREKYVTPIGTTILGLLLTGLGYLIASEIPKERAARQAYNLRSSIIEGEVVGESSMIERLGGATSAKYAVVIRSNNELKTFNAEGNDALYLDSLIEKGDILSVRLGSVALEDTATNNSPFHIILGPRNDLFGVWACVPDKIVKRNSVTYSFDMHSGDVTIIPKH
jgi:hypothetical protein